jgi:plastocyanin
MKTIFLLLLVLISMNSSATVHRIKVSNFQFSPRRVNALVGDTILFVYKNGFHTTTSTTIPAGAAPWDSPMDVNTTRYSYVLTVPGVYNYICLPHAAEMQGIIRVFLPAAVPVSSFAIKTGVNGKPEISWTFKKGVAPQYINIQRSYDAVNFQEIARFTGQDNSLNSFTDKTITKSAFAYYFIESVNANGDRTETVIKAFAHKQIPEKIIASLSPNPLTSPHLMMQFNARNEGIMKVMLQDDKGVVIKEENISAEPGINNAHIHLGDHLLKPGIYYLVCILEGRKETHKIVKP